MYVNFWSHTASILNSTLNFVAEKRKFFQIYSIKDGCMNCVNAIRNQLYNHSRKITERYSMDGDFDSCYSYEMNRIILDHVKDEVRWFCTNHWSSQAKDCVFYSSLSFNHFKVPIKKEIKGTKDEQRQKLKFNYWWKSEAMFTLIS